MSRYNSFLEIAAIDNPKEKYEEQRKLAMDMRIEAVRKVIERAGQSGLTARYIAREIGTTEYGISQAKAGTRALITTYASRLFYGIEKCSCQEALLDIGARALPVPLPEHLGYVVDFIENADNVDSFGRIAQEYEKSECIRNAVPQTTEESTTLLQERIKELASERGVPPINIISLPPYAWDRAVIERIFNGSEIAATALQTLMRFSLELLIPIDYFMVSDYTVYLSYVAKGKRIDTASKSRKWLSVYLRLPPSFASEMYYKTIAVITQ